MQRQARMSEVDVQPWRVVHRNIIKAFIPMKRQQWKEQETSGTEGMVSREERRLQPSCLFLNSCHCVTFPCTLPTHCGRRRQNHRFVVAHFLLITIFFEEDKAQLRKEPCKENACSNGILPNSVSTPRFCKVRKF